MRDRPFSSFFLKSTGSGPPLRIGIQLDDMTVGQAAASVIEDVLAAGFAQIRCVILASDRSANRGVTAGRLRRAASTHWVAWRAVTWLDAKRSRVDDPSAMRDIGPRLASVETIEARWDRDGSDRARLDRTGVERLRAADLDVIVQLGRARPDEAVLDLPRHGVWRFRHGDPDRYADGPPDFWEMIAGDLVTVVSLERLGYKARGGAILGSATFATDMGSPARQCVMPLFGSTHLVIRALWQLHERGPAWLEARARIIAPRPMNDVRQGPTNGAVIDWFVRRLVRRTRRRILARIGRGEPVSTWRTAIRVGHAGLG
ncbi:MAG: hypothetical protein H0T59_04060, partial [Chloroflexi bacterium]|nr:hypothetical protein [Chloroflexota bacterium]